jgi:hypothetical protein
METPSLQDLDISKLKVVQGRLGQKGISFHHVSLDGKPLRFTLVPLGQTVKIPYKPSVFQGTGAEQRVNVQFEVSDEIAGIMAALENLASEQVDCKGWNSVMKKRETGTLIRAKLNISGPRQTAISGVPELPNTWPQHGNVCIRIGTVYSQNQLAGFILEAEALEIQHPTTTTPFQCGTTNAPSQINGL